MVVDFLGKEIHVGDTILWAAHRKGSKTEMELRRGTVAEISEVFRELRGTKVQIKIDVDLSAPNLRLQGFGMDKTAKSVTLSKYKDTGAGKNDVFAYVYVL